MSLVILLVYLIGLTCFRVQFDITFSRQQPFFFFFFFFLTVNFTQCYSVHTCLNLPVHIVPSGLFSSILFVTDFFFFQRFFFFFYIYIYILYV